jgi:hypothetical protein
MCMYMHMQSSCLGRDTDYSRFLFFICFYFYFILLLFFLQNTGRVL